MERQFLLQAVSKKVNKKPSSVESVIKLLEEGNTVPFIARYRKEQTGSLDEIQIKEIQDVWNYELSLAERKEEVIRLIDEQGKLTEELKLAIEQATQLQKVEDLYRPYKQKRRTRATIAKEKGLEPLAKEIFAQEDHHVLSKAAEYISVEHELHSVEEVLAGAKDIIAEWIADEPKYRERIRAMTFHKGMIQ